MRKATEFFAIAALALLVAGTTACRRQSKEEKALRNEIRHAFQQHDYATAVERARRLVEIAPHDDGSWDRLLQAHFATGDLVAAKRALASWRVAVAKPSAKVDEYAGDLALREGDPAGAVQFWRKVITAQPKQVRVLEKIARAERQQQNWKEESAAWTAVIAIDDTALARLNRALCLRHLHQWEDAYADLHRAQQLDASDPEIVRAGKLFERLGRILAEIREIDARLILSPQDFGLLGDRAFLLLRNDDPELALDDASSAAKLAPWAVRPKLFQAIAFVILGKAEECDKLGVERFIRLEALRPEFLETISRLDSDISAEQKNPELYVARAWQLNDISQPRLALADAETASELDPKSGGALAEASYALMKLGRGDEAFERIKRATEADPNFSTAWQYRGELEMQRGDYVAAVESLSRALAINETAATLQKREECYRHLGLLAQADEDRRAVEQLNARSVR